MKEKIQDDDFSRYRNILWAVFGSMIGLVVAISVLIGSGTLGFMPSYEDLENPESNLASEILSSDQIILGSY
ncbi:MAG: hypothetical protein K2M92_06100, partial [Bacteroidales bacterium]|nr:hypothetical protein [Bacteroidales bacterium]